MFPNNITIHQITTKQPGAVWTPGDMGPRGSCPPCRVRNPIFIVFLFFLLNSSILQDQPTKDQYWHFNRLRSWSQQHQFIISFLSLKKQQELEVSSLEKDLHMQNAATILLRNSRAEPIAPILKSLHWLIKRIDFKVLLLVFKSLSSRRPKYTLDMCFIGPSDLSRKSTSRILSQVQTL